jgi:hypothetical protein
MDVWEVAGDEAQQAPAQEEGQGPDEDKGGQHEEGPGLAHAAQVDQHERDDAAHVERDTEGVEAGRKGDEGLDPRRDRDGHRGQVVHHQRGGGQ